MCTSQEGNEGESAGKTGVPILCNLVASNQLCFILLVGSTSQVQATPEETGNDPLT